MNEETLKFIEERRLVSYMNKTKWRELANAITSNSDFEPQVRLKYLRDLEAMPGFSLLDWEWVRYGQSNCIEWMDIDPFKRERRGNLLSDRITDFSGFIATVLKKYNIPYSFENGCYRVWGYANQQPVFV
ncbi:DUF6678 family protein [Microbulbifer sp. TRSA001]|uniref:DUF6678 family protein n=1 Tax=Microbulbifer sp. TRSA001 TaxID=3243381 RepID=UPI00403A0884